MLFDKIQLEESETVQIQTRRHWFVLATQMLSLVFTALAPLAAIWAAGVFNKKYDLVSESLGSYTPEIVFVYCLWLLFIWFGVFNLWTNYYLDMLILTDRRIILLNHKGFFWRKVASFRLERMQDINVEINGLLATLLDFGTVHIETAGHGEEEFKATGMPKPRELKAMILKSGDDRINEAKPFGTTPTNDSL